MRPPPSRPSAPARADSLSRRRGLVTPETSRPQGGQSRSSLRPRGDRQRRPSPSTTRWPTHSGTTPRRATRLSAPRLFATPYFHSSPATAGVGARYHRRRGTFGRWGAAGLVALQQLERAGRRLGTSPPASAPPPTATSPARSPPLRPAASSHGRAAHGPRRDRRRRPAVRRRDRHPAVGRVTDLRLGADEGIGAAAACSTSSRCTTGTAMRPDVHFTTWRWDAVARPPQFVTEREARNVDRTNIWGAHAQYVPAVGHAAGD